MTSNVLALGSAREKAEAEVIDCALAWFYTSYTASQSKELYIAVRRLHTIMKLEASDDL